VACLLGFQLTPGASDAEERPHADRRTLVRGVRGPAGGLAAGRALSRSDVPGAATALATKLRSAESRGSGEFRVFEVLAGQTCFRRLAKPWPQ
jgi:hypothetical protein